MNRGGRNALMVPFVLAIAAFFIVVGFSMPRSNGKALEPDAPAASTAILSPVFTATVEVIPSATELIVGQTLSVTVAITVSEGCIFPIYDLTLSQHGDDAPIFEYVDPPTDTVGPPVSNPFAFSLTAVSTGTVTFRALAYGERYCDDYWVWRYLSGESEPVEVVSPTLNLIYLPLAMSNWPSSATQGCLDSGGTVTTAMCCLSTGDFPNTCAIGACGCAPEHSHEVKICNCGPGKCFNGSECVPLVEQ